jgi:hypothetical protein
MRAEQILPVQPALKFSLQEDDGHRGEGRFRFLHWHHWLRSKSAKNRPWILAAALVPQDFRTLY